MVPPRSYQNQGALGVQNPGSSARISGLCKRQKEKVRVRTRKKASKAAHPLERARQHILSRGCTSECIGECAGGGRREQGTREGGREEIEIEDDGENGEIQEGGREGGRHAREPERERGPSRALEVRDTTRQGGKAGESRSEQEGGRGEERKRERVKTREGELKQKGARAFTEGRKGRKEHAQGRNGARALARKRGRCLVQSGDTTSRMSLSLQVGCGKTYSTHC